MKKLLFFLSFLLLLTPLLLGTQMFVVGEMFTSTTCPSCPPARSALAQLFNDPDNFPYFIPLIWQANGAHTSPSFSTRFGLYNGQYVPHAQWGGTNTIIGATNAYNNYVNAYNQLVGLNSPLEINLDLTINDQNQLLVNAETIMTGNISTTNNRILFILTYDLTGVMDPDYFASVKAYSQQNFNLTSTGQSETFSHTFNLDTSWDIYNVSAVVIVQSLVTGNAPIHQAAKASFAGLMPMFSSNVHQGPPSLSVQFYDHSMPSQNIVSWEWDLNGDGNIDSTEQNPAFTYTEPGTYDITLRVSDGTDTEELVSENYIVVTAPEGISGNIGGTWHSAHSPYLISGDVIVPEDSFLIIEPGVEIRTSQSSITIEGYLYANAEEQEPIVFTSDTWWLGMRIIDSQIENTLKNCHISKANQAALIVTGSRVNIIGNTFYQNSGGNDPGALKISTTDNITLQNNIFANNQSTNGIAALEINASSFDVKNNLFVNNSGQFSSAFGVKSGAAVNFINNTITHNVNLGTNAFHIFNHNSFLQIRNSIIRGAEPALSSFPNSVTLIEYSNISGGSSGTDNIDEDPLFIQPSDGSGVNFDGLSAIWYLEDSSPSVDTGNPGVAYNDPEDPDNPGYALFPAKGTVRNDMGAYGGSGSGYWVSTDQDILIPVPSRSDRITAYPNPFNPSITISLDKINYSPNSPISLKIYNTKGQLVRTLIESSPSANSEFVWDGVDDNSGNVPSGVYFIRFTAENLKVNHKILLLK